MAAVNSPARVTVWQTSSGRSLQLEHESSVVSLQLCDSTNLLTATENKVIRLWDAATGRELQRFDKDALGSPDAVTVSTDCSTMATARSDGVQIVDVRTARVRSHFVPERPVEGLLLGSDARLVLVASATQNDVHDTANGTRVAAIGAHEGPVFLGPDLHLKASVVPGGVSVSDIRSGQVRARLESSARIVEVAFSKDASTIAVVSERGDVQLWDLATRRRRAEVRHSVAVKRMVASRDGKWLLTAGNDRTVRVWGLAQFAEVAAFQHEDGDAPLFDVTRDGTFVVTITKKGVRIWHVASRRDVGGPSVDTVERILLSPDSRWIAVVGMDRVIGWDLANRRERFRLPRMGGGDVVAVGADGAWLAMLGVTGKDVSVVDASDGTLRFTRDVKLSATTALTRTIRSVASSEDGKSIIADIGGDALVVWDASTGNETLRINHVPFSPGSFFDRPLRVLTDATGRLIATAGSDRTVRVWSSGDGALKGSLEHQSEVASLAFTPAGSIVTATAEGTIHLWTVDSLSNVAREVARLEHPGSMAMLALDLAGRWAATSGDADHPGVQTWSLSNPRATSSLTLRDDVDDFALSQDGKRLAVRAGRRLYLTEIAEGAPREVFSASASDKLDIMSLSPDGKTLIVQVTGHDSKSAVRILDADTGTVRAQVPYSRPLKVAAFSPTSAWFATLDESGAVRVLNAADGTDRIRSPMTDRVEGLWVAADGIWVITHALGEQPSSHIRLVDAQGQEHRRLTVASLVSTVTVSPDQRWLATMELAGRGYLWSLRTGRLTAELQASAYIEQLIFSADSRWLASGGPDHERRMSGDASAQRNVYVWTIPTGQLRSVLNQPDWPHISSSPDGRWLMSRGDDNIIRVWDSATGTEHTRVSFAPQPLFKGGTLARALAFLPDGRLVTANRNVLSFESWRNRRCDPGRVLARHAAADLGRMEPVPARPRLSGHLPRRSEKAFAGCAIEV